jgi:photosystem II stability/assembly factor-like uncharacterized protein
VSAPTTPTPTASTPATSAQGSQDRPLFLGAGLGIVEAPSASAPCGKAVYLTTDFTIWRPITPPESDNGVPCLVDWDNASFVSPTDGWILGRNGGAVDTVLYHTTDGGRRWVQQPGGGTVSNGGYQAIGFANAQDGWRQTFPTGANVSDSLETTQNAGATWHTVPGQGSNAPCLGAWGRDVFANALDGFAGRSLAAGAVGDSASGFFVHPQSFLCRTRNGGASWTTMTVAAPPTLSTAAPVYGLPAFFGSSSGILPVTYLLGTSATVAFYSTEDAGGTWSLRSTVRVAGTLKAPPAFSVQGDIGAFPSVAFASPGTWC